MIKYHHFALDNLYLANGYTESGVGEDIEHEYQDEEGLEQCVRRIVFRKREPLRGWDLRFLRNGLELSQADFGAMVDRDAQTVARWEKSTELLPKFVDLTIRTRFAERFEPNIKLTELLKLLDGKAANFPEKILLTLSATGWKSSIIDEHPESIISHQWIEHHEAIKQLTFDMGSGCRVIFMSSAAAITEKENVYLGSPFPLKKIFKGAGSDSSSIFSFTDFDSNSLSGNVLQ